MEEIQKESSVNHKLVTVQELEEKATVLRKLGETLTELKSESCWHIRILCTGTKQKTKSLTLADSLLNPNYSPNSLGHPQPVCNI